MKKILITGMTSPQASSQLNAKTTHFAGVVTDVLESGGHDVEHLKPSIEWDEEFLDDYDAVLVGVSPITSIASNYAYGALNVIDVMKNSDKLTLFVDAPEPYQIFSSLRSIDAKPESIVKPFYSGRKDYTEAKTKAAKMRLLSAVDYLLNDVWKVCLYPELPWSNEYKIKAQVGENAARSFQPVSVDSYLLSEVRHSEIERAIMKKPFWVATDIDSSWTKKARASSKFSFVPAREGSRLSDANVKTRLIESSGAAISPHGKNGTWWSPIYAYAMNALAPIATDWRESGEIGSSWSYIPPSIEELDPIDRIDLSFSQREQYSDKIQSKSSVLHDIEKYLQLQ